MRGSVLTKKEYYYLIGLFLGDGYASYSPNDRHYRVEFCLNSKKDKDIINFTESLLKKANYNSYKVQDKRYDVVYVRINSKKLFYEFTKEKNELRQNNKIADKTKIIGLLSGLIDSEGYVANGEIQLSQTNYKTAKLMRNLASTLNLVRKVKKVPNPKGRPIWRIRVSTEFKNLQHISQKVIRKYSAGRI